MLRPRRCRFPTCITIRHASLPRRCRFFTCITVERASQVGNLRLRCRPACIAPVGAGFLPALCPVLAGHPSRPKNPPPLPLAFADTAKVFRHHGEVFRRNGEALATQAGHRRTRREPPAPSFSTRFPGVNAHDSTRHGVFRPAEHLRGMKFATVFLRSTARRTCRREPPACFPPASGTPPSCLPATADS